MADRFWIGGSGNWSDQSKWSETSGGQPGGIIEKIGNTSAATAALSANSHGFMFIPTENFDLFRLDIYIRAQTTTPVCRLTNTGTPVTQWNLPTTTIATASFITGPTTAGTDGWATFEFSTPPSVASGTEYALMLDFAETTWAHVFDVMPSGARPVIIDGGRWNTREVPFKIFAAGVNIAPTAADNVIIDANSGDPTDINIDIVSSVSSIDTSTTATQVDIALQSALSVATNLTLTGAAPSLISGTEKLYLTGTGTLTPSIFGISADIEMTDTSVVTLGADLNANNLVVNNRLITNNLSINAASLTLNPNSTNDMQLGTSVITTTSNLDVTGSYQEYICTFNVQGTVTSITNADMVYINTTGDTVFAMTTMHNLSITSGTVLFDSAGAVHITNLTASNCALQCSQGALLEAEGTVLESVTFVDTGALIAMDARNNCIDGGGNSNIIFPIKSKTNII